MRIYRLLLSIFRIKGDIFYQEVKKQFFSQIKLRGRSLDFCDYLNHLVDGEALTAPPLLCSGGQCNFKIPH
jgi:hypothetical protein